MKTTTIKMATLVIFLQFIFATSLIARQGEVASESDEIDHKVSIKFFNTLQSLDVKSRGKIALTNDDENVKSISSGGYLRIRKTTFGNKKEVLIESDHDGNLSKYYYDNRIEMEFETEGRRWLRDILPEVVRSTGIAAEDRVNRFFKADGVEGVLDEIEELSGSSVKGKYFGLLLEKNGLNGRDLSKIAREISSEISSSSQQGDIYRKYSHKFLASEESAEDFFRGIGRVSSSSEQGYTLRQVLRKNNLTPPVMALLLDATSNISSSSERGAVLRDFNEGYVNDPEVARAYFDAVDQISSSSEQGSVLRDLLKLHDLSEDVLERLFESVDLISSSSERGAVLRTAMAQVEGKEQSLDQFFRTVGNISSSSEMGSVLRSILDEASVRGKYMTQLLETVDRISSSSERGAVLRRAIPFLENDPEIMNQFFQAVENISSSSEQGYVLTELVESGELDDSGLIGVLETSEGISSSSTRVDVMLAVSDWITEDSKEVREVYKEVAKSLDSTSGYRAVMEKVF